MRIFVDEFTNPDEVLAGARRKLVTSPESEIEFAALESAIREFQERVCGLSNRGIRTEMKKQISVGGKSVILQAGSKSSQSLFHRIKRLFSR